MYLVRETARIVSQWTHTQHNSAYWKYIDISPYQSSRRAQHSHRMRAARSSWLLPLVLSRASWFWDQNRSSMYNSRVAPQCPRQRSNQRPNKPSHALRTTHHSQRETAPTAESCVDGNMVVVAGSTCYSTRACCAITRSEPPTPRCTKS